MNLTQDSEIIEADFIWSPTCWQRDQFPAPLRKKIEVIHEGVDTRLYSPSNKPYCLNSPIEITYTSRALESMRCYNHFYKIIAPVVQAFPNINLTIVGKDKPVYRPITSSNTTLFEESMNFFHRLGLREKITYHPRLDPVSYVNLLSKSHIHFYFSRPFIASWSLLEAMASGCCIVSNSTPMITEFLTHKSNALIVDSTKTDQSAREIVQYLKSENLIRTIASNARSSASEYDFRCQLKSLRDFIGY